MFQFFMRGGFPDFVVKKEDTLSSLAPMCQEGGNSSFYCSGLSFLINQITIVTIIHPARLIPKTAKSSQSNGSMVMTSPLEDLTTEFNQQCLCPIAAIIIRSKDCM